MTEPLFFDTDCISAFLWVNNESILSKLFPGRIVIPKEVYDELKLIQNETKLVRTEKKNENSFFFDGYAILMLETVAKQNIKAPKKELSDNIDNALAELRYYVM